MTTLLIEHRVKDFDKWLEAYHDHDEVRRKYGCTEAHVHRSEDDPSEVFVTTRWPSVDEAQAFMNDPGLPEVMSRAGVEMPPQLHLLRDVE